MDRDYRPTARAEIEKSEMGSETLLYNPANDKVSVLNETAAAIWDMCDGKHSLSAIEARYRQRDDVPKDRDVAQDIEAALFRFRQDGLLEE